MTRTGTPDQTSSDQPSSGPCTCPDPGSDEVGYVAYAAGDGEAQRFVEDERARCPVHGSEATAPSAT